MPVHCKPSNYNIALYIILLNYLIIVKYATTSGNTLSTPERAVKHEHDHVWKLLVTGAPIGRTGTHGRSDRYV
jgi:hypothetical protein